MGIYRYSQFSGDSSIFLSIDDMHTYDLAALQGKESMASWIFAGQFFTDHLIIGSIHHRFCHQ